MTREELLYNEANKYAFDLDVGDLNTNRDTFIDGAKWADEHPRKGLVDIDKACEWLNYVLRNGCFVNNDVGEREIKAVIEDFKKKMEE